MKCVGNLVVTSKVPKAKRFKEVKVNEESILMTIIFRYKEIYIRTKDKKVIDFLVKFVTDKEIMIKQLFELLIKTDISKSFPKLISKTDYRLKKYDDVLVIKPVSENEFEILYFMTG